MYINFLSSNIKKVHRILKVRRLRHFVTRILCFGVVSIVLFYLSATGLSLSWREFTRVNMKLIRNFNFKLQVVNQPN